MFTHAQTTLAALDMELAASKGFARRPVDLTALYNVFPEGIYTRIWPAAAPPPAKPSKASTSKPKAQTQTKVKAKGKGKDDMTLTDAFWDDLLTVNEAHLTKQIQAYKSATEALRGRTATMRPLRTASTIALRAAAVTACRWPINNSNLTRDLVFFCKVGIIEHYMMKHVRYRQQLLPTALGVVRNDLHRLLDPCVEEYQVKVTDVSGAITLQNVNTWRFLDCFETPADARANPLDQKEFLLTIKQAESSRKMESFLKSLRVKVTANSSVWVADEDRPVLDDDIAVSLDGLITDIWHKFQRDALREREGPNTRYIPNDAPKLYGVFLDSFTYKDNNTQFNVSIYIYLTMHLS